jgi:hypothetical protein
MQNMNLRHVAALALVGWILMVPPMEADTVPPGHYQKLTGVDRKAPLSRWGLYAPSKTASDCNQLRSAKIKEAQRLYSSASGPYASDQRIESEQIEQAQCVSTDDPRLKGK